MATRQVRDEDTLRRLDATLEVFRDLCDESSAEEARRALEAILTRQSERVEVDARNPRNLGVTGVRLVGCVA